MLVISMIRLVTAEESINETNPSIQIKTKERSLTDFTARIAIIIVNVY